jgi:predicted transcriptional regulator
MPAVRRSHEEGPSVLEHLEARRLTLGLTRRSLAALACISEDKLARVERGSRTLLPAEADRVLHVLVTLERRFAALQEACRHAAMTAPAPSPFRQHAGVEVQR